MNKKVFVASDHAGVSAKEKVKLILNKLGFECEDFGTFSDASVDYPNYAKKVCESVLNNPSSKGVLICGSGTGMQIAANRFKGIRAAFCFDEYSARMTRLDNDANVITLRAREFNHKKYAKILKVFFETEFSGLDRHKRRVAMLDELC